MTRLAYRGPTPARQPRWWDGWAAGMFVCVLVVCLVYATALARLANAEVLRLHGALAMQTALANDGALERARLQVEIDRLRALPPIERVVVEPCGPRRDERKRVVPVFSRDSQFIGAHR